MSMIGQFRALSPWLLDAVKQSPALLYDLLGIPTRFDEDPVDLRLLLPRTALKSIETMDVEERARVLDELKSIAQDNPQLESMIQQLGMLVQNSGDELAPGIAEALKKAGFSSDDLCEMLSIEKAWHGVHFLLSGHQDTDVTLLGQTVLGGREIGDDLGYGAARFLEPLEVQEISAALARVSTEEMRAKFDPETMKSQMIYPGGWDEDKEGNCDWLLDAFVQVKDYYRLAAGKGFAMLLYLT